jgi:ABC-2 type transport system ATP-binding protein
LSARVTEVSGGTRQKLNLALALLHEPALLLLDEPYAGFDWETYLLFWELARELRAAGCGLLVVSHLVYDARPFDRILTLARGRLA